MFYHVPRWVLGISAVTLAIHPFLGTSSSRALFAAAWAVSAACLLMQDGAIRKQVAGFRDFLERISDWAIIVKQNGDLVFATKGAKELGLCPGGDHQRNWPNCLPADLHPFISELLATAQSSARGVAGPACCELTLPRGDRRVFEITVYRYTQDSSPLYAIIFRDITASHRFSAGLTQMDRYAAVAHVSAGVAHNFNNILAGIMLNAGLLADATGEDQRRLADRIIASAEKGADLCRKLLRFARDEKPTLGPVPVDSLLLDVVSLFETEANRHGIMVTWSTEPELVLRGDRNQAQQILLNLLFNAREAIGRNGQISIHAVRGGADISIAVCNSGPPIPPAQMHLIFLPFFSTKTHIVQGIGMGLAVSQGLAGGMGGHIEAQSPAEGPVCFTLVLPAWA